MNIWEALFLGIIQGLTEFFPVSSSGHLILMEYLLGFKNLNDYLLFDLFCHLGTLGSVITIFFPTLKMAILDKKKIIQIMLALLPLFFLLPFLKEIKSIFENPQVLGYSFLFTAFILYLGNCYVIKQQKAFSSAFFIGISQALAILPGVSRSGSTISCARLLGWKPMEAVTFSFLISIPTILGGLILESIKLFSNPTPISIKWSHYVLGCLSAFLVGILSLKLLIRIVENAKFQIFTIYCLILGIVTLYFFH